MLWTGLGRKVSLDERANHPSPREKSISQSSTTSTPATAPDAPPRPAPARPPATFANGLAAKLPGGGDPTVVGDLAADPLQTTRRVLVVGDQTGGLTESVRAAIAEMNLEPAVAVDTARTPFDALADFTGGGWTCVLLHVGPIQQRPGPAVQAMREQLDLDPNNPGRLILFGQAGNEAICRRLLTEGADAFILMPVDVPSLRAMLSPMLAGQAPLARSEPVQRAPKKPEANPALLPADLISPGDVIDAISSHPAAAVSRVVQIAADRLTEAGRGVSLSLATADQLRPGMLSTPLRPDQRNTRHLVLQLPKNADEAQRDVALHELSLLASDLGKLIDIESRHVQLQQLALADELTGCANKRYFRHFLDKILERAKTERFPVTLLLFDIDDFKQYNDAHGHRVGDAILRQTAALIRRCVRDHDLVARIGGDEFAVVFWEKDDPRVPRDPTTARGRFPDAPLLISQRFRSLLSDPDHSEFAALGARGSGTLTISGGMSVFPYDGQSAADLIEAADRALLFHAKRDGKNSIALVGDDSTE